MDKFATRAFAALQEGKKEFGEYTYHDEGASEIMETYPLVKELRGMTPEDAGRALTELEAMEDTGILVGELISDLDDWDAFFEQNEELTSRHY